MKPTDRDRWVFCREELNLMPPGRTIAISDVHGCDVALERLLDALSPRADDFIVQLGDLCDRGPDTRRVIDLMINLSHRCEVEVILGNHDEMMLGVFGRHAKCDLSFWWSVGGSETIESYGGDPDNVPEEHLEFLSEAIPFLELDDVTLVHACIEDGVPLEQQSAEWLRWRKISGNERPHSSGKRIICGHTSQRSGLPLVWDGWVCIDTRVFDEGGWLTALDLGTDMITQANQAGAIRGPFPLSDFLR